eukprot:365910-Chlamydomonas_euryale.AAC.19
MLFESAAQQHTPSWRGGRGDARRESVVGSFPFAAQPESGKRPTLSARSRRSQPGGLAAASGMDPSGWILVSCFVPLLRVGVTPQHAPVSCLYALQFLVCKERLAGCLSRCLGPTPKVVCALLTPLKDTWRAGCASPSLIIPMKRAGNSSEHVALYSGTPVFPCPRLLLDKERWLEYV